MAMESPAASERLRGPLADGCHDRIEVQLPDQGLAHLVDDGQLGTAPAQLGLQRGDPLVRGAEL